MGLGAPALPRTLSRTKGFSGLFVVHGHTPNDARRDASHADQIKRFRLNLDAGSGLTGVAKMAIIRGPYQRSSPRAGRPTGSSGEGTRPSVGNRIAWTGWRDCANIRAAM